MTTVKKCSKCGQEKPLHAQGMCKSCYKKTHKPPIITCSSCGQEKQHEAQGMCKSCYQMTYKGPIITCSKCGEQKPHEAKGMCKSCYEKTRKRPIITCSKCGQEKPRYANGMCYSCYKSTYKRPIVTCSKCGKEKPHKAKGMCESCYGRSSPKSRNYYYLSHYGVTLEYINCLREQQNNQCAICGMEFDESKKRTQVHVDHNHQTGQIRSLLCSRCNQRIAGDKDYDVNPNVLRRSADYLERWLQIVYLPQQ